MLISDIHHWYLLKSISCPFYPLGEHSSSDDVHQSGRKTFLQFLLSPETARKNYKMFIRFCSICLLYLVVYPHKSSSMLQGVEHDQLWQYIYRATIGQGSVLMFISSSDEIFCARTMFPGPTTNITMIAYWLICIQRIFFDYFDESKG